MLGMYELGGGWLRIEQVKIGRRAFVGNSGMTAPGRKVPKGGLVACARPPRVVPRRRPARPGSAARHKSSGGPPRKPTTAGPTRPHVGCGRCGRSSSWPAWCHWPCAACSACSSCSGWNGSLATAGCIAGVTSGLVLIAAGAAAAVVSAGAEWADRSARCGPPSIRCGAASSGATSWRRPSSSYSARRGWREPRREHPVLNLWLRSLGARVGRGVWCETYWLPEADLVSLGAGSTVNRGCVVQTHLFHDRILSMDNGLARARINARTPQRHSPRRHHRRACLDRPGLLGDAGRDGPEEDSLDRQPDRTVGRRRRLPRPRR